MHECAASVSCARANSASSRDGELGRGLHGPKDGNPKASPPHECRCVQLANGARLETPDGSTILNGSQGVGKTSCPAKTTVTLHVNGVERKLTIAPWTTLLDALRLYLDLTGSKKGCDHGQWRARHVLLAGRRIYSCLTLAVMKDGGRITTIEGLAQGSTLPPLQQAFIEHDAFQCGYCPPGQICSAAGLIAGGKARTADEIREL